MCLLTKRFSTIVFLGCLLASSSARAEVDPRPNSPAALNGLVTAYRQTVIELLKFESSASTTEITITKNTYLLYREQVLTSIFLGLDNTQGSEADKLIVDLSAVYFGESVGPAYSCLVQRRARALTPLVQKTSSLASWCIANLPNKFCLANGEAKSRLTSSFKKAKNIECDIPLY